MKKEEVLEIFKGIVRDVRIIYINFGYRNNCGRTYWAIYLLLNIPICSVYHDVLMSDDIWMYEIDKHFFENLKKLENDFFMNKRYIKKKE